MIKINKSTINYNCFKKYFVLIINMFLQTLTELSSCVGKKLEKLCRLHLPDNELELGQKFASL